MVDRRISEILSDNFEYKKDLSQELYLKDRAFFYKNFIIDEVIKNDWFNMGPYNFCYIYEI